MADTGLGQWRRLEIKIPDFPAQDLADLFNKLKDYVNTLATALDLLLSVLQVVSDPLAAALRALIERLRENVESFLEDLGMYIIYIPVRKRFRSNFMIGGDSLGDITPPIADRLGIFAQPESAVAWNDPGVSKFLVNTNRVDGGNVGFFKTVLESLYDKGDIQRPQFTNEDDHMAGLTLVMGNNVDMFGFLDDIQRLREMFGFSVDSGVVPKVPRPMGLVGRALYEPVNGKTDIFLEWDPVEVPIYKLSDLGGLSLYPEKIAILRIRDDVEMLKARSIEDIMGSRRLNAGDVFGPAEVISLENYSTFYDVTYLDKEVEVAQDETVYYAIAWKLKALTGGDELPDFTGRETIDESSTNPTDYWEISNIARVVPKPTLPASTPPDWHRTPSIADVFPTFARFLRLVVAEIDKLANRLASSADVLSDYVAFLRSEVNRYEAIVTNILSLLEQMSVKFEMPTTGVYSRLWSGKGGNTYFITDLANSLSDTYPNAPPFHDGDEYVTGIVMLAGGPAPEIEKFKEGISLLFGEISEDISDLLERAEQQVEQAEEMEFQDDFSLGTPEVTDDFTEDFTSVVQCSQPETGDVVFNDDFSVDRIVT